MDPEELDDIDIENQPGDDSQGPTDTLRGVDKNRKDLEKFRKKRKAGKGAKESQAAAKTAEKKTAQKAASKKAAAVAAAKLGAKAAIGAATSGLGLVLMIPDLINLLKSKWGKRILGGIFVCGCLPAFLGLGGLLLLVVLMGGAGGDANNMCTGDDNPDWSTRIMNDPCYQKSLKKAEEQTNVPWQILAAVDFREFQHGDTDPRSDEGITNEYALIDLGNRIQAANRLRDRGTGDLVRDKDGNTINTITPDIINTGKDKDQNIFGTLAIISNYRCIQSTTDLLTQDGKDTTSQEALEYIEGFCYKGVDGEGYKLDYAIQDPWLMEAFTDTSNSAEWEKEFTQIPYVGGRVTGKVGWFLGTVVDMGKWRAHLPLSILGKGRDYITGANSAPKVGAVTWLKNFLGQPPECGGEATGGTPGGLPPECNKPEKTPGEKAVCAAASQLGKPYVYGAPREWTNPNPASFDCSSLTGWSWYQAAGKNIGGNTYAQWDNCPNRFSDASLLQPGDLIHVLGNSHVGIYEGGGNMVEAANPELGVIRSSVSNYSSVLGYCRP